MADGQEEPEVAAAASATAAADTPQAEAEDEEEWEEDGDDMEWESGDDGGLGEGAVGQGHAEDEEYEDEGDEDEDLLRFLQGADGGGGIEVELDGGKGGSRADEEAKGSKAVVRTAKELRRDFRVHTAHLALLLHRARLVSRYADDGGVQALALSLVPADLASVIGERKDHSLPTVTRLAEWFHDAFRALPDADVDESEGKEGSSPARLLRVLEQRAGSGHELVQAFVATCRTLGLPARYVCPLDPRSYQNPPYLKLRKKALKDGQGRPLMDLTQADEEEEEAGSVGKGKGKKKRRRGLKGAKALLSARYGLKPLNGSWVWCEVRCTEPLPPPSSSPSPPEQPRKKRKGKAAKASSSSSAAAASASPIIDILSSSSSEDEGKGPPRGGNKGKKRRRQEENEKEEGGAGATRSRWVQVDVLRRLVDRPSMVETLQPGGARRLLLYVVGVEGRGKKGAGEGGAGLEDAWVTDVTRRYAAARWSRVVQCRAGYWWQQHLRRANRRARRRHEQRLLDGDFRGYYAQEGARRAEEEELRQAEEAQPMPTSLEGFKRHPKFVLERHLGRWDVVYPPNVVGMFKGEAVFERQNVHEGATATQWRRNGRVVRAGEKPARVVAVKGGKGKGKRLPAPQQQQQQQQRANEGKDEEKEEEGSDAGGAEAASVASGGTQGTGEKQRAIELYGFWQTEKYQPPALLEGGQLPINDHGNIEVLGGNRAFLPQGTVHRTERGLWQVAKQLGIQYAPALTGFEVKNGRSVPVIEGVVVLQRDEAALLDAYMAFAAQKEEKAAKAREKKILDRWVRLLKGLRIHQDIKNKYGGGGGGAGKKDKKKSPLKASQPTAAAAGGGGGGRQGANVKKRPRVVVEVEDEETTESEGEGNGG